MQIEISRPARWAPLVRQIAAVQGHHDPYGAPAPAAAPRGMRLAGAQGGYRLTCALVRNTPLALDWFAENLDDEYADARTRPGPLHARVRYGRAVSDAELLRHLRSVRAALPNDSSALGVAYERWGGAVILDLLIDVPGGADATAVRHALESSTTLPHAA